MLDKFIEDNYVVVETFKKEGGNVILISEPSQELKECLEKCLGKGVEY